MGTLPVGTFLESPRVSGFQRRRRRAVDLRRRHCQLPGAGKGLFNSRFAQTTRHGSHHEGNLFPIDFFPFTSVEQQDPVTGESGCGVARARKSGLLPKMFFINSATDYWTRAASLLHTDVEERKTSQLTPAFESTSWPDYLTRAHALA